MVVRDPHGGPEISVPLSHLNQFDTIGSSGPGTLFVYGSENGTVTTSAATHPAPHATRPDVSATSMSVVDEPAADFFDPTAFGR